MVIHPSAQPPSPTTPNHTAVPNMEKKQKRTRLQPLKAASKQVGKYMMKRVYVTMK